MLERLLTLRFQLDAAGADNGALRVIPGSHRAGTLDDAAVAARRDAGGAVLIEVTAGDLVVMRPLLLHASSAGAAPGHRRVVHLELAPADALPRGLRWHRAVPFGE